ncbi:MAG TPA: T9SS type A sorting domain-containing protein, partial [Thermoplasmata archaeon]|nr:T9SS type A sorting domain-containing protein [Thermoplasmata archaeon]
GVPTLTGEKDEREVLRTLKVYPNPGNGIFWLIVPQVLLNKHYSIYGVSGRVVPTLSGVGVSSPKVRLDLRYLRNGVYILRIGDHSVRFVKD